MFGTKGHLMFKADRKQKSKRFLASGAGVARPARGAISNKIFVVYGHDTGARSQLEAMLRRWGLDPLFLDQLASEGQTIIE